MAVASDHQQQRVVFYSGSFFKIDGVTLTLRGLISHITNERGADVLVLTADNPSDAAISDFTRSANNGGGGLVRVLRVGGGPVPAPGADYSLGLRVPESTKRALEVFRPTAVHVTNPDLVALWLINWVLREREDCGVMATLHTDFMEIVNSYCIVGRTQALWALSSFLRHVYGLCPAVYAPTEFMRRKVQAEGWDTELGVWGRGVDPDLFSPARRCQDLRRQLGLGPDDVAALWLGRVVQEKKPGVWLRAVQQVQREAKERYDAAVAAAEQRDSDSKVGLPPRVVGICVGEGEAMRTLRGADGVVCVGWKAGEELARVIASCDIMVAPSEIETFGRVTLEAMSCGLPCVVNRECGDHLVQDGSNGFCVPSGDEDGYVEGLRKLVQDKDLRNKMSATGRQIALGYGTTQLYDGMLDIYRSCRETQNKTFRARVAKKRGLPFWEAFGLLIYYVFEAAKMMTAAAAFFTEGRDSEVVRLSVRAFRSHLALVGQLLFGLSCSSSSSSSSAAPPALRSSSSSSSLQLTPPPSTRKTSRPSSSCSRRSSSSHRSPSSAMMSRSSSSSSSSSNSSSSSSSSARFSSSRPGSPAMMPRSASFSSVVVVPGVNDLEGFGDGARAMMMAVHGQPHLLLRCPGLLAITVLLLLLLVVAVIVAAVVPVASGAGGAGVPNFSVA